MISPVLPDIETFRLAVAATVVVSASGAPLVTRLATFPSIPSSCHCDFSSIRTAALASDVSTAASAAAPTTNIPILICQAPCATSAACRRVPGF